MMTYQEFVTKVGEDILSYIPDSDGLDVNVREVHKNNNSCLIGITIKHKDKKTAPNIYLEQFYEEYCQCNDFSEVMQDIVATYKNSCEGVIPDVSLEELDDSKIYGELVRTDGNDYLLRDIPSVPIYDGRFSLIFRYELSEEGFSGSILITDDIAEVKGLTTEKLHKLAMSNTGKQHTPVLTTMGNMLSKLIGVDESETPDIGMYVLGNETMIYGATIILKKETQRLLMNAFAGDILVIPSSVHELILLSLDNMNTDMISGINGMIQEVNATAVRPDEVLDDEYFILRRTKEGYIFAGNSLNPADTILGSSLMPA